MSRNKHDYQVKRSLFSIRVYLLFFLSLSFIVTCSMLLFLDGMDLPEEVIRTSAPRTFFNIVFLSLVFCLIDGVRRKYTVERPIRRILEATSKITQGDFTTRIQPFHQLESSNEFDVIIEDFNQMAEELSGIETLRTDFIANVSHELKTPLSVIQNYATMMQDPTLPEERRLEYARGVGEASRKLSNLITNILKLNKLENQQFFPESERYNLSEQLCECLLGFESVWDDKTIEIDAGIDENVFINADAELLALVWNNLFSNALKFTDAGGRVSVGLRVEDGCAVVRVTDTGCGISPEVGQHIFEKFYQSDTSHAMQGNGLGLALVKRVIDIVGGEICVDSVQGEGSTFTVRLGLDDGAR